MSTMAFVDTNKNTKKPTYRWNDSGELDVFEAARYFSGGTETGGCAGAALSQKAMREEKMGWVKARKSLDMPMRNQLQFQPHRVEKHTKDKKSKQPISPGGRLASFLNSLFSQTSSKKKAKSTTQSMKDEEESPGGRRKRRSSISLFQGFNNTDSKSLYSSSGSGFRTPPPYSHTPTKVIKDFLSHSDHKQVGSLPKCNGPQRSVSFCLKNDGLDDKRLECLDETIKSNVEKNKISNNGLLGDRNHGHGLLEKDGIWGDVFASKEKNLNNRKGVKVEDSAESDTSSDLFELQNYDLGVYSNGLPVYETTHMESIKRGQAIANAAF